MQIAIASGKGGTGKTSLAVSLLLANADRACLLDCDVEEPNCHLFLPGEVVAREPVMLPIPEIDAARCVQCGECLEACQFNALAMAGSAGVLIFPELCHACGGCTRVCPSQAIHEVPEKIGEVARSRTPGQADLFTGTLEVGHARTPDVIRAVKKSPRTPMPYTFIDSPPGTACSFTAAVEDADRVLLVTEATPFGLHDLELAIEALQKMEIPFSVILNRVRSADNSVRAYCEKNNFPLWLEIPESRAVAETYARGGTLLEALPELRETLRQLPERCAREGEAPCR